MKGPSVPDWPRVLTCSDRQRRAAISLNLIHSLRGEVHGYYYRRNQSSQKRLAILGVGAGHGQCAWRLRAHWPCGQNAAMTSQDQLSSLQAALQQLRSDSLTVAAFSRLAQSQPMLVAALPPRYNEVLLQLLDRLESSALFTEESCSFSQKELLDSLQMWLDQAQRQLDKARTP